MIQNNGSRTSQSEVAGFFLIGLINSFYNLDFFLKESKLLHITELDPTKWYPHHFMIDVMRSVTQIVPDTHDLLFRAGVRFLRGWYERGPGKTMIHSGLDWLYANKDSGGFNSVVRGGPPEEIGWCRLQTIDEKAGVAVYEDVTPLHADFIKGVFHGGCILFDDMEFVEVEATSEPYSRNPAFTRKIITVRFRLKPKDCSGDLEARLEALHSGRSLALTPDEIESLIWRYKGLKIRNRIETDYHDDINALLSNTIAKLQQAEEQVRCLAYYDTLTNLPNRRLLLNRLDQALAQAKRFNRSLAVMFLDLDNFKQINNSLGHDAGDQLLKEVASRLTSCVRADDTVSRQGGDEFVVVLPEIAHPANAARIAEKIVGSIRNPVKIVEKEFNVTTSIGICVYPFSCKDDAQELMKKADIAMYAAKKSGRNCFRFFDAEI